MSKNKKSVIGDIYKVPLQNDEKGYIQYIGNDITQLNSDVIRVFNERYSIDAEPTLEEVLAGKIQFYCHVTGMEFGEKDGAWKKVGNSTNIGDTTSVLFRDAADSLEKRESGEYGLPRISKTWNLWRISEPMQRVDKLEGENIKADIGMVTWPNSVVQHMQTGEWQGFYPAYK